MIDYKRDDLERLTNYEIEQLRHKLAGLNRIRRLCAEEGKAVVAEFGFKGSLKAVRRQLFDLRERYMKKGLTDADRAVLERRWKQKCKHMKANSNDPYLVEVAKLLGKDMKKAFSMTRKRYRRDLEIHKKKECICYSN